MIVEQIWTANAYRNFNYLIACAETGEAHEPLLVERHPACRPGRQAGPLRAAVGFLVLVVGLVAFGAAMILFAHRPPNQSEWVFDRPEAQLPHSVRNPLTGAVSH